MFIVFFRRLVVHAYHIVFGTYGFWLPNDPRGSWSKFVGAVELRRYGTVTRSAERVLLTPDQERTRMEAKKRLIYPNVSFSGIQAREVGRGFAKAIKKSGLTIWACSILEQHVHLVVARHTFKAEYIAGLLKGEATKALNAVSLNPMQGQRDRHGKTPSPWNAKSFRCYLESEEAIEEAIWYVNENPIKEGKPQQNWSFLTAFAGLDPGWITYH